MPTNEILTYCPTDTGSNLESQADYLADTARTSGVSAGLASSKLYNKAQRQASFLASQMAQFIANKSNTDVLDDANTAKLLQQITSQLTTIAPTYTRVTATGGGTFLNTYYFFIASGSASATAVYTNNSQTFTVVTTVAAGTLLRCTGTGAPLASGTLTKSSGTGDAAITFYAIRAPLYMDVLLVGGGAGGGSGCNSGVSNGTSGGGGTASTFGTSLLLADGGFPGLPGTGANTSFGGAESTSYTCNAPAVLLDVIFGAGGSFAVSGSQGGNGGSTPLGSGGVNRGISQIGAPGQLNSGAGGAGGGTNFGASNSGGGGGSAGVYLKARIAAPVSSYGYSIAAGSTGGTLGTTQGGPGGDGVLIVEEVYQ